MILKFGGSESAKYRIQQLGFIRLQKKKKIKQFQETLNEHELAHRDCFF